MCWRSCRAAASSTSVRWPTLFEARKCGFASPETAQELTGCVMGSVPPFALNPDLAIVVEEDLLANETLFFNAGRLDRSMELEPGTGWPSPSRASPGSRQGLAPTCLGKAGLPPSGRESTDVSSSPLRQRLIGGAANCKPMVLALGLRPDRANRGRRALQGAVGVDGPELLVGDELIGSKFAYGYGKYSPPIGLMPDFSGRLFDSAPERGDVIVFRLPAIRRDLCEAPDRPARRPHPDARRRLYINGALVPRHGSTPSPRRCRGQGMPRSRYHETLPNGREHQIVEISDAERTTTRRRSSCRRSTIS